MYGITVTNWTEATRTRLQFGCFDVAQVVKTKLEALDLRSMNWDIGPIEQISTAGYDRGSNEKARADLIMYILLS
jgi:hypothetical protein